MNADMNVNIDCEERVFDLYPSEGLDLIDMLTEKGFDLEQHRKDKPLTFLHGVLDTGIDFDKFNNRRCMNTYVPLQDILNRKDIIGKDFQKSIYRLYDFQAKYDWRSKSAKNYRWEHFCTYYHTPEDYIDVVMNRDGKYRPDSMVEEMQQRTTAMDIAYVLGIWDDYISDDIGPDNVRVVLAYMVVLREAVQSLRYTYNRNYKDIPITHFYEIVWAYAKQLNRIKQICINKRDYVEEAVRDCDLYSYEYRSFLNRIIQNIGSILLHISKGNTYWWSKIGVEVNHNSRRFLNDWNLPDEIKSLSVIKTLYTGSKIAADYNDDIKAYGWCKGSANWGLVPDTSQVRMQMFQRY
jgi:hypothetical protein